MWRGWRGWLVACEVAWGAGDAAVLYCTVVRMRCDGMWWWVGDVGGVARWVVCLRHEHETGERGLQEGRVVTNG